MRVGQTDHANHSHEPNQCIRNRLIRNGDDVPKRELAVIVRMLCQAITISRNNHRKHVSAHQFFSRMRFNASVN